MYICIYIFIHTGCPRKRVPKVNCYYGRLNKARKENENNFETTRVKVLFGIHNIFKMASFLLHACIYSFAEIGDGCDAHIFIHAPNCICC